MMIEHFMLANGSSIDRDRNALSVFDLVEDFHIQAVPGANVQIPLQAVVVLKREISDHGEVRQTFRLEAYGPTGASIAHQDMPVVLGAPHRRTRLRIMLVLPVQASGVYRFALSRTDQPGESRETDIIVQVNYVQPPNVQPPNAH